MAVTKTGSPCMLIKQHTASGVRPTAALMVQSERSCLVFIVTAQTLISFFLFFFFFFPTRGIKNEENSAGQCGPDGEMRCIQLHPCGHYHPHPISISISAHCSIAVPRSFQQFKPLSQALLLEKKKKKEAILYLRWCVSSPLGD